MSNPRTWLRRLRTGTKPSLKDRYKAFSGDTFYVAEYDTTYRQLRYNKGYDYLGAKAISYTSGWYGSNYGHITQFKCNYRVYN